MTLRRQATASRRRNDESAAVIAQALHEKQRDEILAATLAALPAGAPLPVTVSGLTAATVPFVDRLHRKGLPVTYGDEFYCSALKSAPWAKVALWDGCVVGSVICKVSEEEVGCIHVRTLVSAFPRRRIASQLLEAVFAEAAALGLQKSSLCVHVRNPGAIALYRSLGYQVGETRIDYYAPSKDKLEAPPDAFYMLRDARTAQICSKGAPFMRASEMFLVGTGSSSPIRGPRRNRADNTDCLDRAGRFDETVDTAVDRKRRRVEGYGAPP